MRLNLPNKLKKSLSFRSLDFTEHSVVISTTLTLAQSTSIIMGVEDIHEVDVDDNDERSDNEEHLCSASRENGALIEIGFAVGLVFLISFVAFLNLSILLLSSSELIRPFLREPANLICKQYVADKDVSVYEEVAKEDERHAKAVEIETKQAIESSIAYNGQDEGAKDGNFDHAADLVERPVLFKSSDAKTKENKFESCSC